MFVICIKDRLLDRHLCLNLYLCVIKVQSVSQSVRYANPNSLRTDMKIPDWNGDPYTGSQQMRCAALLSSSDMTDCQTLASSKAAQNRVCSQPVNAKSVCSSDWPASTPYRSIYVLSAYLLVQWRIENSKGEKKSPATKR